MYRFSPAFWAESLVMVNIDGMRLTTWEKPAVVAHARSEALDRNRRNRAVERWSTWNYL